MITGVDSQFFIRIMALVAVLASADGNGDRATTHAVPGLRGFRETRAPVENRSLLELPEIESLSAPVTQIIWAVILAISSCVVISCCCTAAVQAFEIYRRSLQRTSIIDRLYANKEPVGRRRQTGGLRRTISLRNADPNYISRADQERQLREDSRRRQNSNGIQRCKTRAPTPRTELTIFSVGGGAKNGSKKAAVRRKGTNDGAGSKNEPEDEKIDDDDNKEEAPPAPPASSVNIPGADDMDGRFEVNSTNHKKNLRQRREEDIRRRIEAQKEADRREREVQEQQAREARAAALKREQEEANEADEEDSQAEIEDEVFYPKGFLHLLPR